MNSIFKFAASCTVFLSILVSCSGNESIEASELEKLWYRTAPKAEYFENDTISVDTTYTLVEVPSDMLTLINIMTDKDLTKEEKSHLVHSYGLTGGVGPRIKNLRFDDIDSSWTSSGRRTYWFYKSTIGEIKRVAINNKDTVSVAFYSLDSIFFEPLRLPHSIIESVDGKIIEHHYDWSLVKRCKATKRGEWRHWDLDGNLVERKEW
ncbi:MAG: hypothetical protein MK105_13510 [Crocinitomicaceae bacterium]|nr:hypothetical protein [Crocinitomicaceae bacterium]